jgi:hypothetical protein
VEELEGTECVELRHGVVGQDDVERRVQAGEEVRLGVHPLPLRVEAGLEELGHQQPGVGREVFENQGLERCGHGRVLLLPRRKSFRGKRTLTCLTPGAG